MTGGNSVENKLLNMDIKLSHSLAVPSGAGGDICGARRELREDRDKNLRVVPHPLGPAEPPRPSRPPPQLPKTGERGAVAAPSPRAPFSGAPRRGAGCEGRGGGAVAAAGPGGAARAAAAQHGEGEKGAGRVELAPTDRQGPPPPG